MGSGRKLLSGNVTPLFIAVEKQDLEAVRRLIGEGVDVNEGNKETGETPLCVASVIENNVEIVNELLNASANIDQDFTLHYAQNSFSHNPLTNACSLGDIAIVRALLNKGANANYKTQRGWTPLHFAVSGIKINPNTAPTIVEELIKHQADVNSEDHLGWTPLYVVAGDDKNLEIVKILAENGALNKPTKIKYGNETPLDRAASNGCLKIIGQINEDDKKKKEVFISALENKIKIKDFTRSDILKLFNEIKNPNGEYKYIHQQKNPKWDAVRLFFKYNKNKNEEKFWHTATYQKAVKLLKEAYLQRRNDGSNVNKDDEDYFVNYVRGNSSRIHHAETSTNRALNRKK